LPKGAKLYIYNENYSQILGSFTSENNDKSKLFATEIIFGNTLILEYFEPKSQFKKGRFTIERVSSYFKNINNYKDTDSFGDSDPCQVNINCNPEGNNWQDQKKGVARILVSTPQGQGWCTGTLVNNTNTDCKPYFLTAYHCGNSASASDFNQWIFYFNYEFNGCSNGTEPSSNSMTGSSVRARSNNLDNASPSSDFLLLELNQQVPQNYNVYYNGWNISNTLSPSGVAIHHPSGDVKKISTYSSSPGTVGVNWSGSGYSIVTGSTHWDFIWSATTNGHGVSEGGSSGSPIFNNLGLVIGTLTGGGSNCNATSNHDQHGKMSYHWQSNSSTNNKQLKPWLDPANTGATSLQGTFSPCTSLSYDVVLSEIYSPKGDLCNNDYSPKVLISNNGAINLTSATISYQVNSLPVVNFNWTGNLAKGASAIVDLAQGTTTSANNSITVSVSNPNGNTDENINNNSKTTTFKTNIQKLLPFREDFEGTFFPSSTWGIVNNDNSKTWEKADFGASGNSSTCMYMDYWDYEAPGEIDWFVSDAYDLSDTLDKDLFFDLAYTYYHQTNVANFSYDTLGIAYSIDCGANFFWLWKEGGRELASLEDGLGVEFVPQNNEWDAKTIDISVVKGQPSVIFAFGAINGYGNNMYIDNIRVGHIYLAINEPIKNAYNIEVFPNPVKEVLQVNISMEVGQALRFSVLNALGQEVKAVATANFKQEEQFIDTKNLNKGIYFLKVEGNNGIEMIKFIKE